LIDAQSKAGLHNNLDEFKAELSKKLAYNQRWGKNHNVGFHLAFIFGAIFAACAIVVDFSGAKGASMIGLAGGPLLAAPAAFRMKEKSLWYFEPASQVNAILLRLGSGALEHATAVDEHLRLQNAMDQIWAELTRSIDIKPIVGRRIAEGDGG